MSSPVSNDAHAAGAGTPFKAISGQRATTANHEV